MAHEMNSLGEHSFGIELRPAFQQSKQQRLLNVVSSSGATETTLTGQFAGLLLRVPRGVAVAVTCANVRTEMAA